jgi:hypothetical protein
MTIDQWAMANFKSPLPSGRQPTNNNQSSNSNDRFDYWVLELI